MKQIYALALFLLPFYCFSQLFVKPQGNRESFVYVEGGLLFVERQVHLFENPNLIAGLYLRDGAQLLQGNNNHPNNGQGELSVFQEGKATAYTYNYWSSPVENTGDSNNFGEVLFEPQSKLQSRPVVITSGLNGKANPLEISSRWIYKLEGDRYGDWSHIGNSFDLSPGEGFTMKGVEGKNLSTEIYGVYNNPGGEQRYDFRGKPNNGLIVLQVRKEELKLVGNPYPSALDLNAFLLNNSNITGIAYFWDSNPVSSHYLQDYEGGYGAYSPVLGIHGYVPPVFLKYDNEGVPLENTGTTGEYLSRRFSPIAQGFLVEGLNNGPIFFRNEYRVFQKEDALLSQFKTPEQGTNKTTSTAIIFFNINFNNSYTRQLLLAFHPRATAGADRAMDAKNLMPLPTDAAWLPEYWPYLIDVRPKQVEEEIPLYLSIAESSEVEIAIQDRINFSESLYLLDKLTGTSYDLKDKVKLTIEKGDYMERFSISFSEPKLQPLPNTGNISVYQNNAEKKTEITLTQNNPANLITLFDIGGKKIGEIKGDIHTRYYEVPTENLSNGIYIVKIKSADGGVISKKVIISN